MHEQAQCFHRIDAFGEVARVQMKRRWLKETGVELGQRIGSEVTREHVLAERGQDEQAEVRRVKLRAKQAGRNGVMKIRATGRSRFSGLAAMASTSNRTGENLCTRPDKAK